MVWTTDMTNSCSFWIYKIVNFITDSQEKKTECHANCSCYWFGFDVFHLQYVSIPRLRVVQAPTSAFVLSWGFKTNVPSCRQARVRAFKGKSGGSFLLWLAVPAWDSLLSDHRLSGSSSQLMVARDRKVIIGKAERMCDTFPFNSILFDTIMDHAFNKYLLSIYYVSALCRVLGYSRKWDRYACMLVGKA